MPELNFDELHVNGNHYEYDPVNEEWFCKTDDPIGEQPVSEEVNELLNYIQAIRIPKETVDSMKFFIDKLQSELTAREDEIIRLRDILNK